MKTIVITGGTDGMGAALARHYLTVGDRVVIIGRSRQKFDALVATLLPAFPDVASRSEFITADLSLVEDNRRAIDRLIQAHARIDALILAASFIRQKRHVTSEGHEASWSLFFLSKYLFVTKLAGLLHAADQPVIVNTSVPGAPTNAIDFNDLELTHGFTFAKSNAQQRRANELLGVLAIQQDPTLSYVTWGPSGLVRTSLAGDVGKGMRLAATVLGPLIGKQPADAVKPIIQLVNDPVPGRWAYRGAKPFPLGAINQDDNDTSRLAAAVAGVSERDTGFRD
ncbi:SDR family NAD(P)-dependent oxidoreductase [Microbacterium saperdae]